MEPVIRKAVHTVQAVVVGEYGFGFRKVRHSRT